MGAPKILVVSGAVISLLGIIIGFWGFNRFLDGKLTQNAALKKGSDTRKMFTKLPFKLDFNIYFFNLTNPEEVAKGGKPKLQQVGPYCFDEWKEKVKLVDDRTEDTLTYSPKATFHFRPDKSNGLTGEEIITLPHPLLVGMVTAVEHEKASALNMINRAIPSLFDSPKSVFYTGSVNQFLWEGLPINCNSSEFGAKVVCEKLAKEGSSLKKLENDTYLFSLMASKNGTTSPDRFTVRRGLKNPRELGKIVLFNNDTEMSAWQSNPCNTIMGTDGTIFPPFNEANEPIYTFSSAICRTIPVNYVKESSYKGVPSSIYSATFGDMSSNAEEKCFCPKTGCLKKGAMDLENCTGAPIIITLPHFYEADPDYMNGVEGVSPEKELHSIVINFERMTGTPLMARQRLQFNLQLHPVKKIVLMRELPNVLLPFMWIEEGLDLEDKYIGLLSTLFTLMAVVGVMKYLLLVLGLVMMAGGGGLGYFRTMNKSLKPANDNQAVKVSPGEKY